MPIFDYEPGSTPEAPGTLYFYKQGSAVTTGFQVTTEGVITTPGAATYTGGAVINGGAVFNEDSADVDFRIESNGNANAVFVDAGNDRVGIFTVSPATPFEVTGASTLTGAVGVTGNVTVTTGDLTLATAGTGINIKEGSNATMGTLTLNGATPVVVSTTAVTATSRIFLTHNTAGGTPAFAWVSARSAATSFSVTGTAGDTSVLAWLIVEPAA